MTNPAAGELVQLPYVEDQSGAQVVQPVDNIETMLDGPNLHGEDAPPALPALPVAACSVREAGRALVGIGAELRGHPRYGGAPF